MPDSNLTGDTHSGLNNHSFHAAIIQTFFCFFPYNYKSYKKFREHSTKIRVTPAVLDVNRNNKYAMVISRT